jgi:signal transduction histidine kinase
VSAGLTPHFQRRLKQYLVFRLLVTLLGFLMVTLYVTCLSQEAKEATYVHLYSVLGVYLLFGVASFATFSRWASRPVLYRPQLLVDFALQAVLVWSTGGVVSIFTPLLFVTLAAATAVSSIRDAFALATLTTLLLAGTTLAYGLGFMPATSTWSSWIFTGEKSAEIASYLVASVLGLYTVSSLGSKLSHGLRRAEHLQEEIIENMAEGLLAVDHETRVIRMNGECRRLLGLPSVPGGSGEPFLRQLLDGCEPKRVSKAPLAEICDALVQGRKQRFETALSGPDGAERPVEVKVSTVRDDRGRLRLGIALFSDLSLQREMEKAEERIHRLEEIHVLAMGLAHEIRNPLASIRGCVQEIARLTAGLAGVARFAEIVVRESDRLDRIIEDFFQYAKSAPPDTQAVDVVAVAQEAVLLLRGRQDVGRREVKIRTSRTVPQVRGDRDRLLQVLLNLGINAIHATQESEGCLGVEVLPCGLPNPRGRRCGDGQRECAGVEVVVWDNGPGMDRRVAEKAFTPFFTTKPNGMGLGLAVVERIVREHAGTVQVDTEPGSGTRVIVRLPGLEAAEGGRMEREREREREREGEREGERERERESEATEAATHA